MGLVIKRDTNRTVVKEEDVDSSRRLTGKRTVPYGHEELGGTKIGAKLMRAEPTISRA